MSNSKRYSEEFKIGAKTSDRERDILKKAAVYFASQPNKVCLYNYNFERHDYNWNFNETGVLGGIVGLGKNF